MDWSYVLLIAVFFIGCFLMARVMMMMGNRTDNSNKRDGPGVQQNLRHPDDTGVRDDVTPRE